MKPAFVLTFSVSVCSIALPSFTTNLRAEPAGERAEEDAEQMKRVPLAIARERATLMHNIYAATLDVMHHRYFRSSRATVPARALEDVFAEISREADIQARWISVNTQAMSIKHQPESAFEKGAVAAIRTGKSSYDAVDGDMFRRAGAIPLASSCLVCHGKSFGLVSKKTPRFAALVISIPIENASAAKLKSGPGSQ